MGVAALGRTWERTTGSQLTDLLAGADRALYQAKNAGRNHVDGHRDGHRGSSSGQPGQAAPLIGAVVPLGRAAQAGLQRTRRGGRGSRAAVPGQAEGDAEPEGMARTARISEGPFEHCDVSPLRRISGVSNPLQTQPLIGTGPPPPFPGARPDARAAA